MAYDFQRQQFSLAPPHSSNENVPAQVRAVASILWAHRTKLSASLARIRIEQNALNLHHLLPDREKAKLEAWKDNPCHARITRPDRRDDVLSRLAECDLTHVQELPGKELKSFCLLGANKDVIAFSPDCREILYGSGYHVITSGQLIVQVCSACIKLLCHIVSMPCCRTMTAAGLPSVLARWWLPTVETLSLQICGQVCDFIYHYLHVYKALVILCLIIYCNNNVDENGTKILLGLCGYVMTPMQNLAE